MPRSATSARGRRPAGRAPGGSARSRNERPRSRFRLYLVLVLLAAAGLAVLLRSMLLTALASPLVATHQEPGQAVAAVLIVDGDRRYEEAARLLRQEPGRQALVFEDPPNRLIVAGLLPAAEALARRELMRHDVGEPAIAVLSMPEHLFSDRAAARALGRWLDEHPSAEVAILCDAFSSGVLRLSYASELAERASRLVWIPLPDPRYSVSDWWHNETGTLAFIEGYATLLQARFVGDLDVPVRMIDASAWLASVPGGRPPRRETATTSEPAEASESPSSVQEAGEPVPTDEVEP